MSEIGTARVAQVGLSLKPDFDHDLWRWSLVGGGFTATGSCAARDREDAVLCALGAARSALESLGPVAVVVSLPDSARLWSLADDLALALPGVGVVPFEPEHEELRREAMRALEPPAPTGAPGPLPPLVVATDGSAARRRISWGWLASDGKHGWGHGTPEATLVPARMRPLLAELRAVAAAVTGLPGRDLAIRTDSREALALVEDWKAGGTRLPAGYSAGNPAGSKRGGLIWVREQVQREAARIDVVWVRGHAGDPLNEGADSIAKLARRAHEGTWGYGPDDVAARAAAIAATFVPGHAACPTAA